MEDVFVLSAVRTPIGKYGGGLASVAPCDLAAKVVREAVGRAGVSADDVGHVVFGNVIHTEVRDMYISRVAALNGGLNQETPALTVNRLCGSGMQAIVSAAQAIMLGDCEVAVAGGAESMSRAPALWMVDIISKCLLYAPECGPGTSAAAHCGSPTSCAEPGTGGARGWCW